MFAVLRIFLSIIALSVSWIIITASVTYLSLIGWEQLSNVTFLEKIIPSPPPVALVFLIMAWIPFICLVFFVLIFFFIPPGAVASFLMKGIDHVKLDKDHSIYKVIKTLSKELSVSMPGVYIYSGNAPNAWVYSTIWGSVVGISLPLLKDFSPEEAKWVFAHELAHIKNSDSLGSGMWVAIIRVLSIGLTFYRFVLNGMLNAARTIQIHIVIFALFASPFLLISYLIFAVEFLTRKLFLAMDRFIGRKIEYKADYLASEIVGYEVGINALEKLPLGIEPGFNIFATHPSNHRRISRLHSTNGFVENKVNV